MSTLPAPFGWPGGKRQLKARIIALIPPHKTYVEPFAGAASVFWAKPRSEVEILNDLDPDLVRFYQELPRLEHCDVHALGENFPGLVAKQGQQTPCEFLANTVCSFGSSKKAHLGVRSPCLKDAPTFHQNLPRYKERLQGVKLHNEDWMTTTLRYDAPDTFFYFDPPYHDKQGGYQHNNNELPRLADLLPGLKGKWLLSYSDSPDIRSIFKGYPMQRVSVRASTDVRIRPQRSELLIANFPI